MSENRRLTLDELKQKFAAEDSHKRKLTHKEHDIQCACVNWYRMQYPKFRHNLFAVPNGAKRSSIEGKWMKDEGLLAGVADLILLKSNSEYGALLIEMKKRTGTQSVKQKEWQALIENDGYKYVVCRSFEDFQEEVKNYLKNI